MKRSYDMESDVTFYHVIIKVPDNTLGNSAYAFNREHKTHLRKLVFWLESIYELEVINYCIMSTHAHFIIRRERESKLTLKQAAYRYKKYKSFEEVPDARTCEVRKFTKRLNDLGDFMGNLQKRFTVWYNQQFEKSRRGQLFNHCYKAIQLKNTKALIRCLQYIELNPLRAQMVENAADYEFSSWADICHSTKRKEKLKLGIIKALRDFGLSYLSDTKIFRVYMRDLMELGSQGDGEIKTGLEVLLLMRSSLWSRGRSISIVDESFIVG
ncbi:hypothetical protein PQO03_17000 [Lentisphaera profundi]|uniref:Transposase IS200-like domain-containing protein n=1 Tax=Lentisphaera profundi TaxID=1658616 RepID=A0ABY7VXE9_9BACT|nr:transposase [Lentisphaera profundi]WDE97527.1 hypothetical protein PQO03_17000 [Lentisphaera profundi]